MTTSTFDFETPVERRGTNCAKWDLFHEDVLPLWVADMDFRTPQPVIEALKTRADHGVFGYSFDLPPLRETLAARMADLYDWQITPDQIVFLPGVITGMSVACKAYGNPGEKVLMHNPVYPPFMTIPAGQDMSNAVAPLAMHTRDDGTLHYEIDFDAMEAAIDDETTILFLCSPHNPVGRVWTRDELLRIAAIAEKHDLLICSDEIHCDLILEGEHIPTAALAPEIAARTVTFMAPSKTFNMPSLGLAFAIITDEEKRRQFDGIMWNMGIHANVMGMAGALAAYQAGDDWLRAALDVMRANRDYVVDYVQQHLPDVPITRPEGTYLSWLDCRALPATNGSGAEWISPMIPAQMAPIMAQNMEPFFLSEAQVALNNGARFGEGGEGFARLNFATPRSTLDAALERMRAAMQQLQT